MENLVIILVCSAACGAAGIAVGEKIVSWIASWTVTASLLSAVLGALQTALGGNMAWASIEIGMAAAVSLLALLFILGSGAGGAAGGGYICIWVLDQQSARRSRRIHERYAAVREQRQRDEATAARQHETIVHGGIVIREPSDGEQ